MNFETNPFENTLGLSGKEKKKIREKQRKEKLEAAKDRNRRGENYGDSKVSRRIPKHISAEVKLRDTGRDFGRPNHSCDSPGPPHHIIYFEKFLNEEETGDPHSLENLEAPCQECHDLAHKMNIPSGTSIAEFFREKFAEEQY